jgi:hypothetical protein
MAIVRSMLGLAVLACAGACNRVDAGRAPSASFLVVAGDSTFWVTMKAHGPVVRRSPILLAKYGGRFYEVYVTDDDRSFYDAVIMGQRVYRRDIVTGDSVAIYEDPEIATLAREYGAKHPGERPLAPDEDEADNPSLVATTETDIIDVVGPFATLERSIDRDRPDGSAIHETHRRVIDLRFARRASLRDLVEDTVRTRLVREGKAAVAVVFDSVRHSRDARAALAADMLGHFSFDTASFSVVVSGGRPAVAFLVPGQGKDAGGYTLPLPALPIPPGDWWSDIRPTVPDSALANADLWRNQRYDVIARYDATLDDALLVVRSPDGKEWPVTRIPATVQRIHWLDGAANDTTITRALSRAFDEAALYAGETRIAVNSGPTGRLIPVFGHPLPRERD